MPPFPGTVVRPEQPQSDKFSRASFEIKVVFTDSKIEYEKEVIALTGAYALNSIPAASVTIAAGRELKSARPSKIHATIDKLKLREPVRIDLKVTTTRPEIGINGMSGKWCTVFEGYYVGAGYRRTHQSASYTLQFVHWLDDLACSSAMNGNWHPGVPHDLAQTAEGDIALMAGGSGGVSTITCIVDPNNKIVNDVNLRKDLWSEVLRELFRALAQKTIGRQSTEKDGDANKNGNNAAAIKALDKMPGADNPNPAQLKFNLPAGDSTLALAMVIAISKILKTGLAYSSFWSKLIGEFGAEFLFGVSPAATFANVFPYFGAIKREWITITGADYAYASFNTSLISLIESVEIRFTQNSTSHAWTVGTSKEQSAVANSVSYYRPLARFPMENTDHRGQIIIKDPPTWMTNSIPTTVYGPFTSGLQGNSPNDMGGQGSAQTPNNTPRPAETEKKLQGSALVQGYAEQMFKSEVLNQRRGELSGKLRFDIAPGSIVKIEAPESDIGAGTFSDALNFYAMVTQVSFAIDAETHSAGTSFAFTNLRNETENNNKNLTSDAAPIYPGTDWVGGPLVKEAMPGTTP